ncbi:MAG: hypothetical protein HQL07_00175 [Nitrospirae bacterium]|nr:hypothetical protein [Magnetococcales bacterium]
MLTSWGWLRLGPGNQSNDRVFSYKVIIDQYENNREKQDDISKSAEQSRLKQRHETLQLSAVLHSLRNWWSESAESQYRDQISHLHVMLGEISGVIVMPKDDSFVSRANWIRTNYRIHKALSCRLASYLPGSYAFVQRKVLDDFHSKFEPFKEFTNKKIAGVFPLDVLLLHHTDIKKYYDDKKLVGILNLEARRTRIFLIEREKTETLPFDVPWGFVDVFEDSEFSTSLDGTPEEIIGNLLPIDQDELLRLMHAYPVPHLAMQKLFSHLLGSLRLVLEGYVLREGEDISQDSPFFLAGGFDLYSEKTPDRKDWKLLNELGKRVVHILGFKEKTLSSHSESSWLPLTKKDIQGIGGGIYFSKPGLREVSSENETIETYYSESDLYYAGNSPSNHALSKFASASRESVNSPLPHAEVSPTVPDEEKPTMSIGGKVFTGIFLILCIGFYFFSRHYNSLYDGLYTGYIDTVKSNKVKMEELDKYRDYYLSSSSNRLLRLSKEMDERIKLQKLRVTKLGLGQYKIILEGVFYNKIQGDGTNLKETRMIDESRVHQDKGTGSGSIKGLGDKAVSDHFKEYLGHLFKSTDSVTYGIGELSIVGQDRQQSGGYSFIVTIIESSNKKEIKL